MLSEEPLFFNEYFDLKPEYKTYVDTGCYLYPYCLECPLPKCAYEEPGGVNKIIKTRRNRRIVNEAEKGKSVKEIASVFHISPRSVQRILQQHRFNNGNSSNGGDSNV